MRVKIEHLLISGGLRPLGPTIFEVRKTGADTTQLEQTAVFSPRGLTGLVYWYALYPFHAWIFRGLIRAIARRAERITEVDAGTSP